MENGFEGENARVRESEKWRKVRVNFRGKNKEELR